MKNKFTFILLSVFAFLLFIKQDVRAQCSVNAGSDQTIYLGYAPFSCANLVAVPTGTAPFAFTWNNADTTGSIRVCDTLPSDYIVIVIDSNGCIATDTVHVNIMDVHCGNDNRKVLVCHIPPGNPSNAHTICVSPSAVPAHLAHGCMLGSCPPPPPPPPIPCVVNLGNDTSICSGYELNAGLGFLNYLWSDSSTGHVLNVTQSGLYWVQVSDSVNNCFATDSVVVTIFNAPVAILTVDSARDTVGCLNITASLTGGTGPFSYLWSNGDTTLIIHVCDSLTATYAFTVIDSNGCSSTASVTVPGLIPEDTTQVLICHIPPGNPSHAHTISVSQSELAAHLAHGDYLGRCLNGHRIGFDGISISPNPLMDETRITFTVPEDGRVSIEIFDITGKRISLLYNDQAKAFVSYSVDYSAGQLIEGIYFVRLTKENGMMVNTKMVLLRD